MVISEMELTKLLLIFSFSVLNGDGRAFRGIRRNSHLGEPETNKTFTSTPQLFDQKLDHFTPSDDRTWKQRYYVNNEFYEKGGPIFLLLGGEGEAADHWMVSGAWIDYAKKYKAYCIQLEHRFYGESHPTQNTSVKNLKYLSSEQALADASYFIVSYNEKMEWYPAPKWIAFGGSYSGSLAAWMRMKYPHLVHGAVSSSGPLLALPDFKDYFKVVKESLNTYSPECVIAIQNATKQLSFLLQHPLGQQMASKMFKMCTKIDVHNQDDVSVFYESLADIFAETVQYDKDNRRSKHPKDAIKTACEIMLNKTIGSEVKRLAELNSNFLTSLEEPCLDIKYENEIKELRQTSWSKNDSARLWTYQTCTEFGFFQTSDLNITVEVFGGELPLSYFEKQCSDVFGTKFNSALLLNGIKRTNMMFGGFDNHADNVVYVHGSIDPWHTLGITRTLRKGAPAIFIEGTAHCADMYPSSPDDLPQLVEARMKISEIIGQWLDQS